MSPRPKQIIQNVLRFNLTPPRARPRNPWVKKTRATALRICCCLEFWQIYKFVCQILARKITAPRTWRIPPIEICIRYLWLTRWCVDHITCSAKFVNVHFHEAVFITSCSDREYSETNLCGWTLSSKWGHASPATLLGTLRDRLCSARPSIKPLNVQL